MAITILDEKDKVELENKIGGKLNARGWTANKYLGTDASGNVVEREAPTGSSDSTQNVTIDTTLSVEGAAADAKAVGDELKNLSVSGLTTAQVDALDGMFKIAAFTEDPTAAYTAFKAAFSISGSDDSSGSGDSGDSGEETPDDTTEAALPTGGLADFFDLRNTTLGVVANGGYGVNGSKGGYLYSWATTINGFETDDYGYLNNGGLAYVGETLEQNVTVCTLSHNADAEKNQFCWFTHVNAKNMGAVNLVAKYVDTDGATQQLANTQIDGATAGYNVVAMSISPEEMKVYINGVLKCTVAASDIENFASWVNTVSVQSGYANCSGVAVAIYNKTLSQVEVVEVGEYFKTLEVSA